MKHTPTLEFLVDDTASRAARIEELLASAPPDRLIEGEVEAE